MVITKETFHKYPVEIIGFLISIVVLFLNEHYIKGLDEFSYDFISTIGISLMTTVIVTFLTKQFSSNTIEDIANEKFTVLENCQEYGLYGIREQFPLHEQEIKGDFLKSQSVTIVMNDAKLFISTNIMLLQERLEKTPDVSTTIIIQDYEQDDIMCALTRKNGHLEDPDYYKNKIKDVLTYHMKSLKDKCNQTHELKIYLNANYNTLAIILTDHYAMTSIYRVAPGKTRVPHFIFRYGGKEYEDIANDISKIKELTREYPIK